MDEGLVFTGKVVDLKPIDGADFIILATVVCGSGGKWRGVVRKDQFEVGAECLVYLPDAVIQPSEELAFMAQNKWRVRMCRFKGAPSEVLITKIRAGDEVFPIGTDMTALYKVTKYNKPVPVNLVGKAKALFPYFIPKTDELNYQRHTDLVEKLHGKPFYITEKCDGASTTAYRYKGEFGICSRNLEILWNDENGYCKVAERYGVPAKLPEGYAIQWETCGPKIQGNPQKLKDIDGFAFSVYNIIERRYLTYGEYASFCDDIGFPRVRLLGLGSAFDKDKVELLGEGRYECGAQREGVVVRSMHNYDNSLISFKVINLNYDK